VFTEVEINLMVKGFLRTFAEKAALKGGVDPTKSSLCDRYDGLKVHYVVNGCRETIEDGERIIEATLDEDAGFWGVYFIEDDGRKVNIADFMCRQDAVIFATIKNVLH